MTKIRRLEFSSFYRRYMSTQENKRKRSRLSREMVILIAILLAGGALRLIYLGEIRKQPDFAYPSIDSSYHDYWARGIVSGVWAVPPGREDPQIYRYPYFQAPAYAYFLALLYRVFGPDYLAPRIAQMLIGLLSAALAFHIGKRWWGKTAGLIWAALMAVYWVFIYFEGELMGVSAAVFLVLLLNLTLEWSTERAGRLRGCLAGLVLGLTALFRPNILLFLPAAALWGAWVLSRRKGKKRIPSWLGGLVLGVLVAISPAAVRNYLVSGEFVLISTNAGQSLAVGNNELSDGTTHFIPGLGDVGTPFDWPRMVRSLERRLGRQLTHQEASELLAQRALRFIEEQPGHAKAHFVWRAFSAPSHAAWQKKIYNYFSPQPWPGTRLYQHFALKFLRFVHHLDK